MRAAFALLLVLASAGARAQAPAAAPDIDPDTEVAMREFRVGSELYEQSRYVEAIAAFERARAVKPLPALDYNIARCHDRLAHWALAVAAYERFLAAVPNDPSAAETRARVALLKERVAQAESSPPQSQPAATPSSSAVLTSSTVEKPRRRPPAWAPWLLLGAGAATAGVGVYFSVRTLDAHQSVGDRQNAATVADVTFPVAAVLGAGAVALATWRWAKRR